MYETQPGEFEKLVAEQPSEDHVSSMRSFSGKKGGERIFPVGYGAAWFIIKKAGQRVGVNISSHDLRSHAATFASRSGIPIEIVSKVILRHASLSKTQRYLGKVSHAEAMR